MNSPIPNEPISVRAERARQENRNRLAQKHSQPDDSADIYERIRRGDFKNKMKYPSNPIVPAVLNKRAASLTVEEFGTLQSVKAEYDAAVQSCKDGRRAYGEEERRLKDEFRKALLAYHGMDYELPIAGMLYTMAWDRGHSSGYEDVSCEMEELAEIYHEAIRMRDEAANQPKPATD